MLAVFILLIILFIFQIIYGYLATKEAEQGNESKGNTYLIISNNFLIGVVILCALCFSIN